MPTVHRRVRPAAKRLEHQRVQIETEVMVPYRKVLVAEGVCRTAS
jgi:hypothetical protein